MPIYEYACQKCKAHIEILQKVADKPLTRCRKCGGRLEKEWSQTSFQLKGSGWYVTDYASKRQDAKDTKDTKETKDSKEKKREGAPAESAGTSSETTKKDKPSSTTRASKE